MPPTHEDEDEVLRLADEAQQKILAAADVLVDMTGRLRDLLARVRSGEAELDEHLIEQIESFHHSFDILQEGPDDGYP